MSVTIELPDEVLADLEAVAARRGTSVATLIAQTATELVAVHVQPEPSDKFASGEVAQRLSLSGVGASGGQHGWARGADEALAQGFGRD